jgi:hypothetical protein
MTSLAADPRDWTADQLMTLIAEAIEARDLEAVPHLIALLAFKNPHQAQFVHDGITLMLDVRRESAAREGDADGR